MNESPAAAAPCTLAVVYNAAAGSAGEESLGNRIQALLQRPDTRVQITHFREGDSLRETVRRVAENGCDTVVAAGGDGTISGIASALSGTGKTLGILPLGTFNFFAQRVGVPLELEAAARTIHEGRVAEVNVGEVNGRLFLNKSSVGLYPLAVRHREAMYRRYGRNRLVAIFSGCRSLLRRGHVMAIRVTTDQQERVYRSRFIFVCNNPQELERFGLRGRQCLEHDKLAVYIPEPLSPVRMLGLALRLLTGRLEKADGYEALCAAELQLENRRPRLPVSVDGELEMMETPLRYRVRPGALRVLVPRDS